MDFMDSWGPGSGGIWQDLAAFWDRVWTLLLVCKIRSSDDHKDRWFWAWFSMDVMNSRGPRSGGILGPSLDPFVSLQDQILR